MRKGLKQILKEEFSDSWFDESVSGNETMEKALANNYDVIILDITMPGKNGIEILKQLKSEEIKSPVLILSMHPEDQYATRVMRAGAAGFLSKESAADELINAVRKILSGRKYISRTVVENIFNKGNDKNKILHDTLSDREFEVMKLIASGKTVSEIADSLYINIQTIYTYRMRVLEKMHLKNNYDIMHYVFEQGIIWMML